MGGVFNELSLNDLECLWVVFFLYAFFLLLFSMINGTQMYINLDYIQHPIQKFLEWDNKLKKKLRNRNA